MTVKTRSYLFLFTIIILLACKKSTIPVEEVPLPETEKPVPPPKDTATAPVNATILNLGTGSGNLSIDGKTLGITSNTIIKIKGGSYNGIQISNINGTNKPVIVQNDGLVQLVGNKQIKLSNLNNVTISGNGTPGISRGFVFKDRTVDGAPVQLTDNINNFTLQNVSFQNLVTYGCIQYTPQNIYNGSEGSYSKNLKFLNIDCDNTGTLIRFRGSAQDNSIKGLIKDIEIAYATFQNSRKVGSAVVLESVDSYNIHHNFIKDINQESNNHNGIFYLIGNGKFYNNYVKDHQGNAIRAWCFSLGDSPKEVLIFNNIVANSREYSAFELQTFKRNIMPGKTTYVNAKVFNNTCGNLLPKSGTFPAQILDLYTQEGGKCEVFNNLGYQFPLVGQNNTNPIWNQLGSTKPSSYSNKYFKTYTDAGITDNVKFGLASNSGAKSLGGAISLQNFDASLIKLISVDYYGRTRSTSKPSIGAVE
jgi:hypothetical protein